MVTVSTPKARKQPSQSIHSSSSSTDSHWATGHKGSKIISIFAVKSTQVGQKADLKLTVNTC